MIRCGIMHSLGGQTCNRRYGHKGNCRCKATRRADIGTVTYSEWVSRDGKFLRHVGYYTIYPKNAIKGV